MGKIYHENTEQEEDGADTLTYKRIAEQWKLPEGRTLANGDRLVLSVCAPGTSCRAQGTLTGVRQAGKSSYSGRASSPLWIAPGRPVDRISQDRRVTVSRWMDCRLESTPPSSKHTTHSFQGRSDRPQVTCIATETMNLKG